MKSSNIIFLIFLVSTLVACGGAEERKAAYLAKAAQSFEVGDLDKARIELKNVLQIDPKDARARFQLGKVHEGKRDYRKAFGSYLKASELDPENSEYHAKLGRFYLLLARDIDKAIEKKDIILNKDKDNIYGLLLKAGILLHQNKRADAKKVVEDVFSRHPDHVESALLLATYYSDDKKYDKAAEIINISLKHNPETLSLKSMLAKILYFSGDYEQAEVVFKNILDLQSDNFSNYLKLANFYQKTGKTEEAISILHRAIKEDPKDISRQMVLVRFIRETKGMDSAIKKITSLIQKSPGASELMLVLGGLYVKNDDIDSAISTFKKIAIDFSEDSAGIKSRIYLASIYIQKNNKAEAERIIDDAIIISPNDSDVNLIKAKLSILSKDTEQAIISLRTVLKDAPEKIEAYLLLAATHRANDENNQADAVIAQAYDNNRSNPDGLLELSKYHLKNNDINQANKIIDNYLSIDNDNYEALSLKSRILSSKKQYDEVKQYTDRILLIHPDKGNGYIYSALTMLAEDKKNEAIVLLEKGYLKTNHNRQVLMTLTKLEIVMKDYDSAIRRISDEIASNADDAELYMTLSGVYIASGDFDKSEESLRRVIKINPGTNKPYIVLSKLYLKNGQKDKAKRILNDGLMQISNDYSISLSLAGLYEANKNYDSAIATYEVMLKENADNVVVTNNLAALLSEHRTDVASLDKAKVLANKLKDVNQPVIQDTVGWVFYKTGNYDGAVAILKGVVEKAPENPVFNYHLGMAYYKNNDRKSAKIFLSKSLENDTKFTGRSEAVRLLKTL